MGKVKCLGRVAVRSADTCMCDIFEKNVDATRGLMTEGETGKMSKKIFLNYI